MAYVRGRLQRDQDAFAELRSSMAGVGTAVRDAIATAVVQESRASSFRGCPYLYVAVEHVSDEHPVAGGVRGPRQVASGCTRGAAG